MNKQIKIADTLYRMSPKGIELVTVEKVGSKFFYIKGELSKKYDINTLTYRDRREYICQEETLYRSEQEIADIKEHEQLMLIIQYAFSKYRTTRLTLKQLREIKAIIFEC